MGRSCPQAILTRLFTQFLGNVVKVTRLLANVSRLSVKISSSFAKLTRLIVCVTRSFTKIWLFAKNTFFMLLE